MFLSDPNQRAALAQAVLQALEDHWSIGIDRVSAGTLGMWMTRNTYPRRPFSDQEAQQLIFDVAAATWVPFMHSGWIVRRKQT